MAYRRTLLRDFGIANSAYANATITYYVIDPETNEATTTKATLYAEPTGTSALSNPVNLSANGQFTVPHYLEQAVLGVISGATVPDHNTGVIFPQEIIFGGTWETDNTYFEGAVLLDPDTSDVLFVETDHVSGTLATDKTDGKISVILDMAALTVSAGAAIAAQVTAAETAATNAASSESEAASYTSTAETHKDAAASSASAASTSESNASGYATTALGHANDAASHLASVQAVYDTFDDRFLGAKSSSPSVDNDGNALTDGAMYWDTTDKVMYVYDLTNTTWIAISLEELEYVEVTDATYTIQASDFGKCILGNRGTAQTFTFPQQSTTTLTQGFWCLVRQVGAGQITMAKEGSDTFLSLNSATKSLGQGATFMVDLQTAGSPNTISLSGQITV